MYFVYILSCSDGSYYIGSTQDLERRVAVHQSGHGPDFTAARLPVALAHSEKFATIEAAVRRERQLKRWTHAKKEALIAGDTGRLKHLSRARGSDRT